MLIGIDMLGVQSPEGSNRGSARYGRQLVSALLAGDPTHRYVLYTHEGLPTDRIPSARHALRVSLEPKAGGSARLRSTIQRVIDRNPDGLDWLILLDPFEPNYGGIPPEVPIDDGLKVASLVLDLAPTFADDRRLAPLRRHDAILAVSEATATECRERLGPATGRVTALGLASEVPDQTAGFSSPIAGHEAVDLRRLGITGTFLLANMASDGDRADLGVILDAHRRLPIEVREATQLAIAGPVDDPWGAVGYLHEHGCDEGLVLVGEVDERTLRSLYGRCAAFVSPTSGAGSGLSIVEAMGCGAAVVTSRAGDQAEVVGDAGLLVDPSKPAEIAEQLAGLLADVDRGRALRERAKARSARFGWEPVVEAFLERLARAEAGPPRARFRVDLPYLVRPRVALFPDFSGDESASLDLATEVPAEWRAAYDLDLYFQPGDAARVDRFPDDCGCFASRQFDRRDAVLGYHAVVYHFRDAEGLELRLRRLRSRPGLVFLPDEVDLVEDERALDRLREVFRTSSRVVVRSSRQLDRIRAWLPEFVDQLVEISPEAGHPSGRLREQIERCSAELGRRPGRRQRPIAARPRESTATSSASPQGLEVVSKG